MLRLLIGTAAEGSDELLRRARLWQAEMDKSDPSRMVISPENETEAARLRYTLVGFLFQAIDAGYNSLSRWIRLLQKLIRLADVRSPDQKPFMAAGARTF